MSKPIARINTFTNMVYFYKSDGSRDTKHPNGFYNNRDLDFYNQNYIVKFI